MRTNRFSWLLLPIVMMLCAPSQGFENLKFSHVTIEEGLSQNTVNAIVQDKTGFLWIGTQDGLNKFNGLDFVHFKNDPADGSSLNENHILSVFIDRKNVMWIGTRGRGLNRMDLKSEKFTSFLYDPRGTDSISDNFISAITGDRDDNILWIGTQNNGLNRFETETHTCRKFVNKQDDPGSISGNKITTLFRDKAGVLWIGTEECGLNAFLEKDGKFDRFLHDASDSSSLSDNTIQAIFEDGHGNFWIGTDRGLNLFDRARKTCKIFRSDSRDPSSLSHDKVTSVFEDRQGRLWVGTEGGLNLFDHEKGTFTVFRENAARKGSISSSNITRIFEDNIGTLWFGTFTGGMNKLTGKKFSHIERDPTGANTLPQNSIWAIFQDSEGMIWLGTENEGLCRWDRDRDSFTTFSNREGDPTSLSSNVVQAIFEDSLKRLWVGTERGLNLLDRKENRFTRFLTDRDNLPSAMCDNIMRVVEGRDGNIWLATYGGVQKFEIEKNRFTSFVPDASKKSSLSHKRVRSIFQDSDGIFWFGTEVGLNRFEPGSETFTLYDHDPANPDSISHNRIFSITEDKKGFLWVSTKNGLNRLDRKTGKFKLFSEKDGLANNTIYGVQIDGKGCLWMSTNNGLSMLDPDVEKIRNFNVDDGLQSNEFNMGAFFQSGSGEMFFGGINGVNSFFPDRIEFNKHVPPVILTTFRKLDKVVFGTNELADLKEIGLSFRDNFFSFEFAALDFVAPLKNQYAYKMEGFDSDWIHCGNRRYAGYTNLSGGRFTFRVKASNNDGVWNETGASIDIEIPPPPWKTWWAYCLYVLAVFGCFYAYVAWKKMQHEREMKFQKMLNDAANRFVPHEYFSILGKNDILDVQLGDQIQKDMTIFFSDIRSFTNISEKMSPKENIDFINEYLSRVGPVIRDNNGFIDKYIGDAVMALFANSADDAIFAALSTLKAVEEFNRARKKKNEEGIRIGIGLNTGTLMLGTVGEQHRINATVISDAVNLASRIEGQTKVYGVEILITENTHRTIRQPGNFLIRSIDKIAVKGKDRGVSIFEIFNGSPDPIREYKTSILPRYEEAYSLFFDRNFLEAGKLFRECAKEGIPDGCVRMYLERCEFYSVNPPPENWDGVTKLHSK